MYILFVILIFSLLFAFLIEQTTVGCYGIHRQKMQNRFVFFLLLCTVILPVGLRRMFNDTGAYINNFASAMTLSELILSDSLHILKNPGFEIYTSLLRGITDNYSIYFMLAAIFVQYSFVRFIRLYVYPFPMGITLLFCLGTYVFSIAAMKQTFAMAILLWSIPMLLQKRYVKFSLIVFCAFLFHTYAIAFLILPLFTERPWGWRTIILIFIVISVIGRFETTIGAFLDFANESGKVIAEYEVFDNAQVNIFRVLVYAVVPIMSLIFKPKLFDDSREKAYWLFINMSIISCSIMLLGTVSGANMFARMAMYFEFGIICGLPWMINKLFVSHEARIIRWVACGCFMIYFMYANMVAIVFDDHYRSVSLVDFVLSLLSV